MDRESEHEWSKSPLTVLITGAGGFIGQRLTQRLLRSTNLKISRLILTDIVPFQVSSDKKPIEIVVGDLANETDLERLMASCAGLTTAYFFHGVMSGTAEANFELGMTANFQATRMLIDALVKHTTRPRIVYASSLAVYGNLQPGAVIDELSPIPAPESSYGSQKMMCEYLIQDCSRREWIDGMVLRFPTVTVRPGKPSGAASSFVSGIIREPCRGEQSVLPVRKDFKVWICSPNILIHNLEWAAADVTPCRTINLPGITVSIQEMMTALSEKCGEDALKLIREERDEVVENIVGSWPTTFDTKLATQLGFVANKDATEIVEEHLKDRTQR